MGSIPTPPLQDPLEILAEFVFLLFLFNRVFRLNFNLNYCLCILDDGNGLPLYVPDILKILTTLKSYVVHFYSVF
jgi:hypothetical protein